MYKERLRPKNPSVFLLIMASTCIPMRSSVYFVHITLSILLTHMHSAFFSQFFCRKKNEWENERERKRERETLFNLTHSLQPTYIAHLSLRYSSTATFNTAKIYKLIYFSFLSFCIFAVIFLLHSQIALVPRRNLLISANINQRKRFIVCAQ